MIDISKYDKAEVLAALYNASKTLGLGILHFNPKPMTKDEAQRELDASKEYGHYFDYLKGRVMKVELKGDSFDPWGYDRDNGDGAAARALAGLQASVAA